MMATTPMTIGQTTGHWQNLNVGALGMTDATGWSNPQHYKTIQLADINGDGQAELLARSGAGLLGWHYNAPPMDLPTLFQAPHYEVTYRLDLDPSLKTGTFALAQVIPPGDSHTFRCTLFNTQGYPITHSVVPEEAVNAAHSLASLPGRFLSAHLNYQNSNLPDLVIPVQLPEAFATLANQRRITFTWSVIPAPPAPLATWPAITTIFNNDVSLEFDGTSTFVDLGNPPELQISGQITLQAWVKPNASDGLRNIIAHGYNQSPKAEVYLRIVGGQYEVGSWNGKDHAAIFPMPDSDLGRWVHLCGVYDGTHWTLYRNGLAVATTGDTTGALAVTGSTGASSWALGARGGGGERFFTGRMRNIALWKTARTAQQVQTDMLQPPLGKEPGLVAYWALTEGAGGTVNAIAPGTSFPSGTVQGHIQWIVPRSLQPLLMLPQTPFRAFQGKQATAYTQISQVLVQDQDLRSKYTELDQPFDSWTPLLDSSSPPQLRSPQIFPTDWQSSDWQIVRTILSAEVQAVSALWKLKAYTDQLLTKLAPEQQTVMNSVISQLTAQSAAVSTGPSASDQAGFWLGAILSAAFGILTIFVPEEEVALNVGLLFASYAFGDISSLPIPTNQSTSPNFPDVDQQIAQVYTGLGNLSLNQTMRILNDAVLLPIAGRRALMTKPQDADALANALQKPLRLAYYQAFISANYVISVWVNNPYKDPIIVEHYPGTFNGSPSNIGAPSYAYWATPGEGSSYNLYVIHDPSLSGMGGFDYANDPKNFPSQAAMTDLFGSLVVSNQVGNPGLGVTQAAFFTGVDDDGVNNGWENIMRRYISPPQEGKPIVTII